MRLILICRKAENDEKDIYCIFDNYVNDGLCEKPKR